MIKNLVFCLTSLCFVGFSFAQQSKSETDVPMPNSRNYDLFDDVDANESSIVRFKPSTKFASTASRVVGMHEPVFGDRDGENIARQATELLENLNDAQRLKINLPLDHQERSEWTNLPARPNAGGLRLGDLNESQLTRACQLLAHVLSQQGYEKIRLLMLADDQLLPNGQPRSGFGVENFSLVIFGKPGPKELWSIQLDGHHVGLNVAVKGERVALAPSFIGCQPTRFQIGDQEITPLNVEIDGAFILANLLSESQFKTALISGRRGQLRAGPGKDGFIPEPRGLRCSEMNAAQLSAMKTLIWAWVGNAPPEQARQLMKKIEAEFDQTFFSWEGPRNSGSDVSYTIQGPTLLIEFAYQDLGGNPQDHLHTQYRNFLNDYGKSF